LVARADLHCFVDPRTSPERIWILLPFCLCKPCSGKDPWRLNSGLDDVNQICCSRYRLSFGIASFQPVRLRASVLLQVSRQLHILWGNQCYFLGLCCRERIGLFEERYTLSPSDRVPHHPTKISIPSCAYQPLASLFDHHAEDLPLSHVGLIRFLLAMISTPFHLIFEMIY